MSGSTLSVGTHGPRPEPADFASLTEVAGEEASMEQVERLARRYYWASQYCVGKDVLETACGTAPGVGLLASVARSVTAGDISQELLRVARRHYEGRFGFPRFDAQRMPFPDESFDVVLCFEAIYYLSAISEFLSETKRILRPGGVLLIATANKDLYDFNPSRHSHRYLGVVELNHELGIHGFRTEFFGDTPVRSVSARQRALRPAKAIASRLGLVPKSMKGKRLLKRLVFGGLVAIPAEITWDSASAVDPTPVTSDGPDSSHKVIFCAGHVNGRGSAHAL